MSDYELHHGDMMEVMPTLLKGSVAMVFAVTNPCATRVRKNMREQNRLQIVAMYTQELRTTVSIAEVYGVSSGTIGRWLKLWGVSIRSASVAATMRPAFTPEHKEKLSVSRHRLFQSGYQVANKGKKASLELRKKNITGRLGSSISLSGYDNIEKLKFLTRYLSKHRAFFKSDDKLKSAFLKRFYFDSQFNAIYDAWLAGGKSKWQRPSIDHKTPISRGGTMNLKNLQFLTWFENRAKAEMTEVEWQNFCIVNKTSSALFIRR